MTENQIAKCRLRLERFWLDLPEPAGYTPRRLARIAKRRWKIDQDYHQLGEEPGLDRYGPGNLAQ